MDQVVKIFDSEVKIRKFSCANKEEEKKEITRKALNFYIQLNPECNGRCKFCEYYKEKAHSFDFQKLKEILLEINRNILINKINITGGEPTLNLERLDNVVDVLYNYIDINHIPELVINTNGYNLKELKRYEDFFSNIALSRHHYDDEKNFEIFQTRSVPTKKEILEFRESLENENLLFLRCNLIKGYIDNFHELQKYLDHAIELKCYFSGFATLMNLNDYCKENQIDFAKLIDIKDESFLKVNYWKRYNDLNENICKCANYVYQNENGEMCRFFSRLFCLSSLNEGQLVYDGQYLRDGFNGKVIY